jgi:hypothetical protein
LQKEKKLADVEIALLTRQLGFPSSSVHKGDKGTLEETITDEDEGHPDLQSLPLFAATLQGTKKKTKTKREQKEETKKKKKKKLGKNRLMLPPPLR